MEPKKTHIRIGDYAIQYKDRSCEFSNDEGYVVLDTTQNNAQVGDEYKNLIDALEVVLRDYGFNN